MLASESFLRITGKHYLYNITPIINIPSIIQFGILSHEKVKGLRHESIALLDVQEKRSRITVTNGFTLHHYANMYFDFYNPMLSRRRSQNDVICILAIDYRVLDIDGCVVTDRNAATEIVRFLDPMSDLKKIDFDKVYARYWKHPNDEYEERNHKAIKCAEVLIPEYVPYEYVMDACVVSEEARRALEYKGFRKKIYVEPKHFF